MRLHLLLLASRLSWNPGFAAAVTPADVFVTLSAVPPTTEFDERRVQSLVISTIRLSFQDPAATIGDLAYKSSPDSGYQN